MEIRKASLDDVPRLVSYGLSHYPERKEWQEDLVRFWFSKSEDECQHTLVVDDDGRIRGQMFFSSMVYFFEGKKNVNYWAFELLVDEELRKDNWGLDLMLQGYNVEHEMTSFAVGSGPDAMKINKKLGFTQLGEVRKYVGLVHPFYLVTALWRGNVSSAKFPHTVGNYHQVSASEFPNLDKPFNPDLLELGRDLAFLQWRFTQLHDYVFYRQKSGGDNYFVVRTIVQKHITALELVDYRCDLSSPDAFEAIVKTVNQLAARLHLPVVVCGSSLAVCDTVLERHHYKSIGRPRPICSQDKRFRKAYQEPIDKRAFTLVTFADSDGDVYWQ